LLFLSPFRGRLLTAVVSHDASSSWWDSNHQDHWATFPLANPVSQQTMIHPNMSDLPCQHFKWQHKNYGHLPTKLQHDIEPWNEVHVNLIGPWMIPQYHPGKTWTIKTIELTFPFENPVWLRTMIHPNMSDTYQPKFNMILNHGMKFMSTWLDHGWFHNALPKVPSSPQCQMWSNCFKSSH
jgi:hypothetical protein